MKTWLILFIVCEFISATAPITSKVVGQALGLVSVIAKFVFMALVFFFAPHWWYGLITLGIFFLLPMFVQVNPNAVQRNPIASIYSIIASHLQPIVIVLMYYFLLRGRL